MDGDLYPVLEQATAEELALLHPYALLHQSDVPCEARALTQVILDMGYNNYQSTLCHIIHHLDGTASVNDPVPEMEATMLVMLFNQAVQNVNGADLVAMKQGLHRFGLRRADWSLQMQGEAVDGARLQQLLLKEDWTSCQLTEELVAVIFTHLLAKGDAQSDGGMLADGWAVILFGHVFCILGDILKGLFGPRYDKLIPIAVLVAMLRKRRALPR